MAVATELTDLEVRINNNSSCNGLNGMNTKILACTKCCQRMLEFAVKVHCHQVHTEEDEGEAECEQKEGKHNKVTLTRS